MVFVLAQRKKPAGETRMACRLGWSLSALLPGASVVPLGWSEGQGTGFSGRSGVFFWLGDCIRFWRALYRNRPQCLVVCSADLYFPALVWKMGQPGCRLVFDVQENQALNLRWQAVYSHPLRRLAAGLWADWVEPYFFSQADGIWLAEAIYTSQLGYPGRYCILENKVPPSWLSIPPSSPEKPLFLFSGVLSREAGILSVLRGFAFIRQHWPAACLCVAGYAPDSGIRLQISEAAAAPDSGIETLGISRWVSDTEIASVLSRSFAVCVAYRETAANAGKHPTRLFEAGFFGKPVVLRPGSLFLGFASTLSPVLLFDFDAPDAGSVNKLMEAWARSLPGKINPGCAFETGKVREELIRLGLFSEGGREEPLLPAGPG